MSSEQTEKDSKPAEDEIVKVEQSATASSSAGKSDEPKYEPTVKTEEPNSTGIAESSKPEEKITDEKAVIDAIVERLMFFFGDANVRQDRFVRNLLMKDGGIVPIETLLKFNTIKQHTTDRSLIAKAVGSDQLSDRIILTDDSLGVKRVKPFTAEQMDGNIPLSLVVGNLPIKTEDGKESYAVNVDDIRTLFEQYGRVALVKLRYGHKHASNPDSDLYSPKKNHKKGPVPRGSALVEFESEEALKKAADDVLTRRSGEDVEPKRKLKTGDKVLEVSLLKEYLDEVKLRIDNEPEETKENEEDDSTLYKVEWKPGCVLKLDGLPESCDREALLDAVGTCLGKNEQELKEMKIYADFSRGQTDGALRFEDTESIKTVREKLLSGDVQINGQKVEKLKILEGDEESKYWADYIDFKSKQKRQRQESSRRPRHSKKPRRSS